MRRQQEAIGDAVTDEGTYPTLFVQINGRRGAIFPTVDFAQP